MTRIYECQVCGYLYDPDVGDPRGEVEPGVGFEELPPEWACPWCMSSRDEFKLYIP
ncbi:MAG: rubredoxin [Actinobacteria bacterium]|nr:rubredoxin [Actinomycetota bacterium]MCG2820182.1 rubredoxin [Actinomycetes bacterium]MBU4179577.1 rubredoxin [Actinomycetota bacterium]MBU4219846.1 rubredoxin [Actinomycetota bacterium]MBU4357740.1 rubredoxin [Actinomycetota bacterium]